MLKIKAIALMPFSQLGVIRNMAPRKKKDDSENTNKKGTYEHYIPAVPVLSNFEDVYKLKYHLIKSYEELKDFYTNEFKPNSFLAWDTETTDLSRILVS